MIGTITVRQQRRRTRRSTIFKSRPCCAKARQINRFDQVRFILRRCCVVARTSARLEVRSADTDGHSTPGAVRARIVGQIPDYVLIRQLVGNLGVHVDQICRPFRQEETSACFLCKLSKTKFSIRPRHLRRFFEAQADRIDNGLRTLGRIQELLERDQAGRVFTVREHNDHLSPNVIAGLRFHLFELSQDDIDRVVEGGRSAGAHALNRRPPTAPDRSSSAAAPRRDCQS